jgi:6-phosphogluconolactonase (cycloisomerase 2 family)
MKTRMSSWLALPLLLLTGCPQGGGGEGGFQGTAAIIYTANDGSNTISGFTIGTGGALSATSPATFATNNTEWLTVSSNGQLLYASNQGNHTISGFTINGTTSVITPIGTPIAVPGTNPSPRGITLTPNRQFLYVANSATNTIAGFSIGAGGVLTSTAQGTIATGGTLARGIAVSPNGQFLYVANSGSNTISGFTIGGSGALTAIGTASTGAGSSPEGLAISPNSAFLFAVYQGTDRVAAFAIGGGGSLTPAAPQPSFATGIGGEAPQRVVISPNGSFLYVTNTATNEVAAFTIGSGGQLTLTSPNTATGASTAPIGITIDPTGQFLYVANSGTHEVGGYRIGVGGLLTTTTPASFSVHPQIPIGIATPGQP